MIYPNDGSSVEQQRVTAVLDHYPEMRDSLGRAAIRQGVWIDVARQAVLLETGQRNPRFPLLVKGQIRVWFPTVDGMELLLYAIRPGDLCAMTALTILSTEPSRVRAVARQGTVGVGIDADSFRCCFQNLDSFRLRISASETQMVHKFLTMLEEVTRLDVSTRLSRRLLAEAPLISMTHQELADGLGCSRERISRVLERFQKSGWVRLGRREIRVLDSEALRRAAIRQSRSRSGSA